MKRFLRDNGLTLALSALFLAFLFGQSMTGLHHHNDERAEHGDAPLRYREYVESGYFLEATMENWESEFLQMAVYVIFTVFLYQRGSSESKKIDDDNDVDRDPRRSRNSRAPWPVKRGGLVLKVYENSLSIALLALFVMSFTLHAVGGAGTYNADQLEHGGPTVTPWEYLHTSQFWFESFQNWQSEFLSIAVMVYLSVYLRQRGSPESKPVDAPHDETG